MLRTGFIYKTKDGGYASMCKCDGEYYYAHIFTDYRWRGVCCEKYTAKGKSILNIGYHNIDFTFIPREFPVEWDT